MLRSRLVRAFVAIALLAALPFLFSHRALAVQDPDFRVLFGPVGITPGERASLTSTPSETPMGSETRMIPRGVCRAGV